MARATETLTRIDNTLLKPAYLDIRDPNKNMNGAETSTCCLPAQIKIDSLLILLKVHFENWDTLLYTWMLACLYIKRSLLLCTRLPISNIFIFLYKIPSSPGLMFRRFPSDVPTRCEECVLGWPEGFHFFSIQHTRKLWLYILLKQQQFSYRFWDRLNLSDYSD